MPYLCKGYKKPVQTFFAEMFVKKRKSLREILYKKLADGGTSAFFMSICLLIWHLSLIKFYHIFFSLRRDIFPKFYDLEI